MKIIIKFVLKNVLEKKFRTFLILFSITISSALFFASSSISDTIVKLIENQVRQSVGTADVVIQPSEEALSPFISSARLGALKKDTEYMIEEVSGSGIYKVTPSEEAVFSLHGFDLDELQVLNPVTMEEQYTLYPFKGSKAIISKDVSEKYGLDAGSSLEIYLSGKKHRFTIAGICNAKGLFADNHQAANMVVPIETLSSIFNTQGKVSSVYVKLNNPLEKPSWIEKSELASKDYHAVDPFPEDMIRSQVQGISTIFMFMFMVIMALFMSMFIIYSSFKVITMERLPVIGTLRSIGATRKTTDMILLTESTFYGVAGGILGCAMGIGILYLITLVMLSMMPGAKIDIDFTLSRLISTFILALVVSLASSILPILKVSKIPVKDIVLNMIEKKKNAKRTWKLILGLLLVLTIFIVPRIVSGSAAVLINGLCIILLGFATALLIPYITFAFGKAFSRIYGRIFGNEGTLAAQNIKDNKNITNNITLLAIGISTLFLISTISTNVVYAVVNTYQTATHDIWFSAPAMDRNLISRISAVEGVSEVYPVYENYMTEVPTKNMQIMDIVSVDTNKLSRYWDFEIEGNQEEIFKRLESGRSLLLTNTLRSKLGVNIGDEIPLEMPDGERMYKIAGFFNTLWQNGSYALASEKYFKEDLNASFYHMAYIKTYKDPEEVAESLKKKFQRNRPFITTLGQLEQNNLEANASLFAVQKGFSVLTLIIGIFGVLNNLIISFIERKRSLAILRSVGMSKKQTLKMVFLEAFSGGIIGGVCGVCAGLLMLSVMPYILKAIDMPSIALTTTPGTVLVYITAGIIITVVASISPAVKSSKLNIIESIKYE